MKFVDN